VRDADDEGDLYLIVDVTNDTVVADSIAPIARELSGKRLPSCTKICEFLDTPADAPA